MDLQLSGPAPEQLMELQVGFWAPSEGDAERQH